ncbi:M15 family metallopeptidase [uncultured Shewanella sp.]|uniref:M15 family metallopeptidase n=1 Tax=uncultured Shewanella sp. TaxID=173975 RepID=UPI00261C750D|nr:M15 family metallopeptidase [uncultured Shewanella sp.]
MFRFSRLICLFAVGYFLFIYKVLADDVSAYGKKKFDDDCAPQSRLVTISIDYYDFDGVRQRGTIKTLDTISSSLKTAFNHLYVKKFPIYHADASLIPDGPISFDDTGSENLNNTASYACREITGGGLPSVHAYGAAIDINPRENPYIGFDETDNPDVRVVREIIPAEGWMYLTREQFREQKDEHKGIVDGVVDVFKQQGVLRWGGDWNNPIDYMHFEIYRDNAILFLTMDRNESVQYFNRYKAFYKSCQRAFPKEYRQRNFNDLSRAIAKKEYDLKPVDIYLDPTRGFYDLMSLATEAINNPMKEYCLFDTHTGSEQFESFRSDSNPAVSEIDALRAIK